MLRIAWDTETHRFDDSCVTPPPVCLQYCEIVETLNAAALPGYERVYSTGRAGILPFFRGKGAALDVLEAWLVLAAKGECQLIGAEVAYDALVSIVGAYQRSQEFGERLFGLFVAAYDRDMIVDVLGRQKLLELAIGCYRKVGKFSLKDVARRLTGRDLSKDADTRTGFGDLEWLDPKDYPAKDYQYALDDGISTAEIWIEQETSTRFGRRDPAIARHFPGLDPLLNQYELARASIALKATSAYGLKTDPRGVAEFELEVRAKYKEACDELVAAGLVRREWKRDTSGIEKYLEAKGHTFPRTAAGALSLTGDALRATADPALVLLADWLKFSKVLHAEKPELHTAEERKYALDVATYLVGQGLVRCEEHRNTKVAARRLFDAYSNPESLGLDSGPREVPRTDSWDPKKNPTHVPTSLECVKLDAEACEGSEDPLLQTYAEYTSLWKALSTDLPILKKGLRYPIHTRFEDCLETGRTSSSKPNIQNVRRLPGIRECFVPRHGFVFVDVDYPSLELHTLAQTCYWTLGYSVLGEILKRGDDPHLRMGAAIAGVTYDEAKRLKAAKDPVMDNYRTAGKGVNFGAPGGLGKKTFAVFAYKSYKVRLREVMGTSDDETGAAKLIKLYHDTMTEMPDYFRLVNSWRSATAKKIIDADGREKLESKYNVVQPYSGRLRAGASYCAACNSPFQGLGADVAKRALWLVFKAQSGFSELGEADPLYGAFMVNFVHDQIIMEALKARAAAAGWRLAELMNKAGKDIMPDTNMVAEPTLAAQWSKKAVTVYMRPDGTITENAKEAAIDEFGRPQLAVWDLFEACQRSAVKKAAAGADVRKELLKDQWPTHVVDDTLRMVA